MKYTAAFAAALLGASVEASRIPLHHNPLTLNDYMEQKESLVRRAEHYSQTGEHIGLKDYMNT